MGRLPLVYVDAVARAGGRPRVLSTFRLDPSEDVPAGWDVIDGVAANDASALAGASALLLPGGGDIDPAFYGHERHARTHKVSRRRDEFEMTLLQRALEEDMPVLCICKGMQLLNVHLGGSLIQHLADDPDNLDHDRDRPRAEPVHKVRIKPGSALSDVLPLANVPVNSHHHQGIGDLAPVLEPVGWAEDDVLEAVESGTHRWVVGVQWHPEAMVATDERQLAIFGGFVGAARDFGRRKRTVAPEPELAG